MEKTINLFTRVEDLKRVQFILDSLSTLPVGSHILDFGCGNGNISIELALMGYKVTAVDQSIKALIAAKEKHAHPNIDYTHSDLFFKENKKFDGIVCSEVLEHVKKPLDLIHTLKKKLNKEGAFVVTVPNGFGPREVLVTKPVQKILKQNGSLGKAIRKTKALLGYSGTVQSDASDLSHIHFFSRKELQKISALSGFKIERMKAANFIEGVFPFSLFFKRSTALQKLDCTVADLLPVTWSSGLHCMEKH